MFTYHLHLEDGSDAGEATYAMMIKRGEDSSGSCRSRLPDASHAGCREPLPKLPTVRGSESPRTRSLLPQTRTRQDSPLAP
jgi:hypothetical protein